MKRYSNMASTPTHTHTQLYFTGSSPVAVWRLDDMFLPLTALLIRLPQQGVVPRMNEGGRGREFGPQLQFGRKGKHECLEGCMRSLKSGMSPCSWFGGNFSYNIQRSLTLLTWFCKILLFCEGGLVNRQDGGQWNRQRRPHTLTSVGSSRQSAG